MSRNDSDTTRRTLLKTIGATGLVFGATGAAVAGEPDDVAADSDDGPSTEGYWERDCTQIQCDGGNSSDCQRLKRYCNAGGCSGWEPDGCCSCF